MSIVVERDELARALDNLFNNALLYGRNPSGELQLQLEVRRNGSEAVVAVADSGPGVPLEDRARIFEAFYTARAPSGHVPGTGIGLSVVNEFVNVHLLLETRKNATVIPTAAVQRGPQGNYVYVVNPQNKAEVRQVNIAITEGNLAQITTGVSPDERVVTDGQDKLQPGSLVDPHSSTSAPAGKTAQPSGTVGQ